MNAIISAVGAGNSDAGEVKVAMTNDEKEILYSKLREVGQLFIDAVDSDPGRRGVVDTPDRFSKYWMELLEGQFLTNDDIAYKCRKTFDSQATCMVIEQNIRVYSHCEHHLAPMELDVAIAYIPKGKVLGLSKIARVAKLAGKRLQLQEKLGEDIAYIIQKVCEVEDVAVFISGVHLCLTARGISAREAVTKTSTLKGQFLHDGSIRAEFVQLLQV